MPCFLDASNRNKTRVAPASAHALCSRSWCNYDPDNLIHPPRLSGRFYLFENVCPAAQRPCVSCAQTPGWRSPPLPTWPYSGHQSPLLPAAASLPFENNPRPGNWPNGISWVSPAVNHCFAHGTWNQASYRCGKAHHCLYGLLPVRVARPRNAAIAPLSQVPFRFATATGRAPLLLTQSLTSIRYVAFESAQAIPSCCVIQRTLHNGNGNKTALGLNR
jgi:hypothetical protein